MNQHTSPHGNSRGESDHLAKGIAQAMAAKDWNEDLSGDDDDDKHNYSDMIGGLSGLGSLGGGGFLNDFLGSELGGGNGEEQVTAQAKDEIPSIDSSPPNAIKTTPTQIYPSYQEFVIYSEIQNGGKVDREAVEKAWELKCRALYKQWKTTPEVTRKENRLALSMALSQANGGMGGKADMEEFWRGKMELYQEREINQKRANRMAKNEHFRRKAAAAAESDTAVASPNRAPASYLPAMSSRVIDESYDDDEE
ncbi:hypothetical protein IFR05_000694 [Cadophora sp. M221]|nr:hypothetical protein IFR05_000694 [Cadophora sp. M221]